MAFEEKTNWVYAVATMGSFAVSVAAILVEAQHTALVEVPYVAPMLLAIGGAIVVSVVGRVAITATWPRGLDRRDQRDRDIARLGSRIGNSFLLIAAGAALVMAMAKVDQFWIANAIYLSLVLSALLGSLVKAVAYHGAFQAW